VVFLPTVITILIFPKREEEVEWLDDLEGDDEETIANEATQVVEQAFKWCDEELAKYDDEEDED
jgi:hypothetical protein